MSKQTIVGFMMGISVGAAIGYFLKPPEEGAASKLGTDTKDRFGAPSTPGRHGSATGGHRDRGGRTTAEQAFAEA